MITCIVNANTLAVSEYSIAALDVVSHDGELYFVLVDGLVKLAADGDTDFTAAVQTGALYLAGNKIGVVPRAYVGAKTSAALQLTVSTYSYGATLANEYAAPVPVASTSRAQVVPLGKGAEAEAWQFKIDSVAPGANWGLASLEAVVSQIKRPRL